MAQPLRIDELTAVATGSLSAGAVIAVVQANNTLRASVAEVHNPIRANVLAYGAVGDGSTDNTSAYAAAVADLPAGGVLDIPFSTSGYKGDLVLTKAITVNCNNNVLIPQSTGTAAIYATGTISSTSFILSGNQAYGALTLPCTASVTSEFAADDLILVQDDTARPSDSALINYEVHKVKSVASQTITLVTPLRHAKAVAAATNVRKITPITGIRINGVRPQDTASGNNNKGIYLRYCSDIKINGVAGSSLTQDNILLESCYDFTIENVDVSDPLATGSGQGYGLALSHGTRYGYVNNLRGSGMRHVVTCAAAWDVTFRAMKALPGAGVQFMLAHNSIGGFLDFEGEATVDSTTGQAVVVEDQGFTDPYDGIFRKSRVKIKANTPRVANAAVALFEIPVEDCEIDVEGVCGDGSQDSGSTNTYALRMLPMDNRRTKVRIRARGYSQDTLLSNSATNTPDDTMDMLHFEHIYSVNCTTTPITIEDVPSIHIDRIEAWNIKSGGVGMNFQNSTNAVDLSYLYIGSIHINGTTGTYWNFNSARAAATGCAGYIGSFSREPASGNIEDAVTVGDAWSFTVATLKESSKDGHTLYLTSTASRTSAATAFTSGSVEGDWIRIVNGGAQDIIIQNAATVVNNGAASITLNATTRSATWQFHNGIWYQVA